MTCCLKTYSNFRCVFFRNRLRKNYDSEKAGESIEMFVERVKNDAEARQVEDANRELERM